MSKRKATKYFKKKLAGYEAKQDFHGKLFSSEEPDVSSILKIPGTGQTDETDDLYDHPLHSTALSVYEEGEDADNGNDQYSKINESTGSFSDPEKNTKKRKTHTMKTIVRTEDSEEESSVKNTIPKKKIKSHVKKNALPERETNHPVSKKVPKKPTKVTRYVTKENIVLKELEKITTDYKEEVEQEKYKNVIDKFHARLKDQFTEFSADAEKVKNTKLKQTKMVRKTNKTRQRLIEIKGEIFRSEPELKKLKKEHSKLKEKISCLKNAVQFIKDLKSLQQMDEKEHSQEKLGACMKEHVRDGPQTQLRYGQNISLHHKNSMDINHKPIYLNCQDYGLLTTRAEEIKTVLTCGNCLHKSMLFSWHPFWKWFLLLPSSSAEREWPKISQLIFLTNL